MGPGLRACVTPIRVIWDATKARCPFAGRDCQLAVHSGGGAQTVLGHVTLPQLCESTAASNSRNSLVARLSLRADAAPK